MNTDRIPLDVADLDAGWFERVLGCAIESVELVDAHSGTTGRARVRVEVADPPESRPLFVKLAPFDARQRAFVAEQGMGVAEARFYRDVARHCPIRIPRAVHADHDGERYVMVLEDIVAAGARFPRTRDDDILQIVEGVIDNFAALHGAYWQSARLAAGGDLEWIAHRTRGYGGGGGRFVRMAVDAFGDRMPPAFHALAAVYCSRGREIADLIAEGAATLVHGDAHLGNMYAVGTAPGFLDWAMIGHAPGMRDVAYFLCNSVPTELRRAEEHRLLDRYRAGLATAGVTLAAQDAWAQYRMQAVTGWVAAVSTAGMGARWQPERIGLAGTARANATIDDLGTVEALRAALGDG